jgi:hypothetical protein
MRIARYVDPQMIYTAAKAVANRAPEAADAGDPLGELSFKGSGMILDAGMTGGTESSQKYAIATGWSRAILDDLIMGGRSQIGDCETAGWPGRCALGQSKRNVN